LTVHQRPPKKKKPIASPARSDRARDNGWNSKGAPLTSSQFAGIVGLLIAHISHLLESAGDIGFQPGHGGTSDLLPFIQDLKMLLHGSLQLT
jgi:hypothetical protein